MAENADTLVAKRLYSSEGAKRERGAGVDKLCTLVSFINRGNRPRLVHLRIADPPATMTT
jgi:hypothetical protein